MSRSLRVRSTWWRAGSVALLVAIIAGGCGFWPFESDTEPQIRFMNDSDETVDVVYLPATGGEVDLALGIDPGRSAPSIDVGPCALPTLIARNEAGEEVDRYEERLCRGETWTIGGDLAPPPS